MLEKRSDRSGREFKSIMRTQKKTRKKDKPWGEHVLCYHGDMDLTEGKTPIFTARVLAFEENIIERTGPLCHIFNLSLKTGVFPQIWKTASVQPIFKNKGERTDPKNYRPIALLPSISKVFEHFVQKQLLDYCLTNAIIPDEQFGFLPKRSTVWQLLTVLEDIHRALDDGVNVHVHACFLDISKAFDRVNHGLLLDKLARIGVKQTELAWFNSYLRNRNITTRVDGICSSESKISSGVPQGSVLGPLLFIVYMRDLPDVVSGSSALFADDTLVYDQCHGGPVTTCCRLQRDLSDVQQWAEEWATTFNPSKSAVMVFRGRH